MHETIVFVRNTMGAINSMIGAPLFFRATRAKIDGSVACCVAWMFNCRCMDNNIGGGGGDSRLGGRFRARNMQPSERPPTLEASTLDSWSIRASKSRELTPRAAISRVCSDGNRFPSAELEFRPRIRTCEAKMLAFVSRAIVSFALEIKFSHRRTNMHLVALHCIGLHCIGSPCFQCMGCEPMHPCMLLLQFRVVVSSIQFGCGLLLAGHCKNERPAREISVDLALCLPRAATGRSQQAKFQPREF